ncbi:Na+/H+ antiporter NhaA [Haloglycomyces albus]|uniref:Na+/H+ antiporter NhaA n=1 Tax=Haloglycomyces albus TaxID=526067 RepID=UPI00046D1519|nr:Na+/H+ antiporter NhaA [Haloglycomyces albus]
MPKRISQKVRKPQEELLRFLRIETTGGILLLVAAVLAVIVANSPWGELYSDVQATYLGIDGILKMNVQHWASDFLLAFFFLVVGLELKRELVVGQLRDPKKAMLPVIAAAGGIIVPALVAVAITWGTDDVGKVWPVPVATDIAFALAVLAVCARSLPSSLRIFLLTLAIADDIGAIAMIAFLYSNIELWPLVAFVVTLALWIFLQRRRINSVWIYIPLGLLGWYFLHEAGVHATIAAVLFGLATRVKPDKGEDTEHTPCVKAEHALQPFSAGIAVPVFAFFSAGVAVNADTMQEFSSNNAALAVVAGLFFGKFVGVTGGAWLAAKFKLGSLSDDLKWTDISAVAILCGCGFTVALLIAELAYPGGDLAQQQELVKTGVLVGSTISAIVGGSILALRSRVVGRQKQANETEETAT